LFYFFLIRNLPQLRERGTVHPIANSKNEGIGEDKNTTEWQRYEGKGMQIK